MDQEKVTELIKKNKWLLRQLTGLNNEIRQLKGKIGNLEKAKTYFPFTEKEIVNIKVGLND